MIRVKHGVMCVVCFVALTALADEPTHGERPERLVIRGAMVVEGPGTPAEGPMDVFVEGNRIVRKSPTRASLPNGWRTVASINARGKYLLPGFINMHGHIHTSWMGTPASLEYIYKLWLMAGITTVRDVGSDTSITLGERRKSAEGSIVAPRLFLYFFFSDAAEGSSAVRVDAMDEKQLRAVVRQYKKMGADGIKLRHFDRETVRIVMDEAKEKGLRVAHHVGVEDMNAWDNAEFGTNSIEHWYGVPEAALTGVQEFPGDFNHSNELHRFRYAGRVWRETEPEKLTRLLKTLVDAGVAWDPTFAIYEACRDLQRAVTQPWLVNFLHPGLAKFFEPNPTSHGSFFFGWTHTDEVYWRENFRLWMDAVKQFERLGGTVTTGEDAGYIYQIYGFCYLRELELQQEAGFHPLEVIRNATVNGAKVLGKENELGRIKEGYFADMIVVDGNPLEDLHILLPRGIDEAMDRQHEGRGGIEWTIKDGIPYRASVLVEEVRGIVKEARGE